MGRRWVEIELEIVLASVQNRYIQPGHITIDLFRKVLDGFISTHVKGPDIDSGIGVFTPKSRSRFAASLSRSNCDDEARKVQREELSSTLESQA